MGITEGERGFEQTRTCYLTKVISFFKTIKEHFEEIQKALINGIKEIKEVFDQMEANVDQHVVDKKKAKEQLKEGQYIRELKEKISCLQKKHSAANPILDFKALDSQNKYLHAKVNALQDLNKRFRAENENAQIKWKTKCVTIPDHVKPKVLAPGMYAIDVELIPPRNRNNREVHLQYLKHLKESVGTLRKIVEEARVEKPLDSSLASACLYTKHSQELLEYVIGTCSRDFNKRDRKISTAPLNRKMQVTFVEPGCSKHMTGDRSRLMNFVKKFIGIVRFHDHFGAIMGYGDYVIGDSVISRVYYVEGLGHNLFYVGKFCDSDLEVAFGKHSCYVRTEGGVDLLKCSWGSNLYTISVEDIMKSSPICLLSKASKNKSWLWHRRLNHLNFGTINDLARKDLVRGLSRLKFRKDHLCSAYQLGKSKNEDLEKLKAIADVRIFIGYAPNRKGYRIYNKRTHRIMETIHVQFDKLTEPMAPVHIRIGLEPILLTPGQISSGLGIQKALINEIKEMKEVFDQMEVEVDQNAIDKKCDEIEKKNLLIENENLIVECLSKDVFYTATESVLTVSRFSDMHDAFTAAHKRIAELEAENSNLTHKIQNNDHDEMIKHFSKLEMEHLNLQLKYQHLKERFGKKKSLTSSDAPPFDDADPILDFKALDSQNKDLNAKVNALQDLNERLRAENKKVKQHYKELYDSIEPTCAKTIEKTTSLLTKIETLKNNREVHLDYLKHLKESVETLREIVEEARAEKLLDSSLASACLYTKHSQELLKYVIGTLKCATVASGLKPRSNIKKDRTLPAKSELKIVENHPRNNKSSVKRKNHVDSSISSKRTVINSTSNSVCKTCNKCLISFKHDKCVVKSLKFVKKPVVNKVWRVKQVKQVWQATEKLFTNIGYQWKPTGRKFTLGEQCPLTRFTKYKVVPIKQPENVSTSDIVITERFSNTSQKPLTRYQRKNKQEKAISTITPIIVVLQSINDIVKPTVVKTVLWGGEAEKASKRRRSLLDHKIQQLPKGSSEGYGIIPEVLDEPKGNSEVANKQAGNVQTSLTLSSAKLEIQSMVDVPIHQEDLVVQRTPLINTVILMVTDKTTSTPKPPTTQAQVQMCSTSCWKDSSRESRKLCEWTYKRY
ncbi:integrase, catalytic region, zinc finger, CCHC-type containing protein [Tanacetum coccineum]